MRQFRFNLHYILVALCFTGAMQSCDDDYFNKNATQEITITASTAFSNTTSRAVYEDGVNFTADDVKITKYCFLMYNANKTLVEQKDIQSLPFNFEMKEPLNGRYYTFLLGNVDSEMLGLTIGESTIDDLSGCVFEINRLYNIPQESEKDQFTWSGYLTFYTQKNLDFVLNPNVAKITAKITNNSTESVIKSVRVKNVVNKVRYAQNALNEHDASSYVKNVSEPSYIKYDIETLEEPIATGETKEISWYVPQNIQGDGDRIPVGNKANETNLHGGIPDDATYLEIDGVRTSDNVTASYRVYPGIKKEGETTYATMTNFDVKADVIYNLDVAINNDGIADESNITNGYKPNSGTTATAKIKLPENSNCYMIHPKGDRIADVTVYELPISRVNQYWQTVAKDATRTLDANSEWTVEVIWQDINKRAIKFCDEYGVDLPDVAPGEGLNPFCFKLVNNTQPTYGNVLVGLKKTGVDGYLWSWHLWITDYNPDAAPANSNNSLYKAGSSIGAIDQQGAIYATPSKTEFTNTADVTYDYDHGNISYDGNVQHYHSAYSDLWNNSASASIWDNGLYKNKWIMDRNLGAQSSNVSHIEHPEEGWGLYYQFGRKDPFSYMITYDIEGKERTYTDIAGTQHKFGSNSQTLGDKQWAAYIFNPTETDENKIGSIANGIKYPNVFFAPSSAAEWALDATNNDWYSPTSPANKGDKTIFDPCPAGWRLPLRDAFDFFREEELRELEIGSGKTNQQYADGVPHSIINKCYRDISSPYTVGHTPLTIYAEVTGPYDSSASYDDRSTKDYNSKLTGYGDRHRMYAHIFSTKNDGSKLQTIIPFQGYINGSTGILGNYLVEGSDIFKQNPEAVWDDYNCHTARACVWTVEKPADGINEDAKTGGNMIQINTSTFYCTVNARQERLMGRLYIRFHGQMGYCNWLTSIGQNVRCIQE